MIEVGCKKDFIEKTPVLPVSGWMGDNFLKKSDSMPQEKGTKNLSGRSGVSMETLYDVLDKVCPV